MIGKITLRRPTGQVEVYVMANNGRWSGPDTKVTSVLNDIHRGRSHGPAMGCFGTTELEEAEKTLSLLGETEVWIAPQPRDDNHEERIY